MCINIYSYVETHNKFIIIIILASVIWKKKKIKVVIRIHICIEIGIKDKLRV